jgi:membrane-associated protease RseP (regulator of RpoE activity)
MVQILIGWLLLYLVAKVLKIENRLPWISVGPLYVMIKSDRLNKFLEGWSERHRGGLKRILDIGVLTGYVLMGLSIYFLVTNLLSFFSTRGQAATAELLIPGITISFETLIKMLPAIILILFSHELSHKIAMHVNNVPVKNMGLLLFYVIPGAFVEPDEESFPKMSPRIRMQVLAAGTFANIIVSAIFAPIVLNQGIYLATISPFFKGPSGVLVTEILPNTTLARQNSISVGDVIIKINDVAIQDYSSLLKNRLTPGVPVNVTYIDRDLGRTKMIVLVPGSDPNNKTRGILGFIPATYFPPKYSFLDPMIPIIYYEVVFWIFFLGVNVAMFNMMPILMIDGYGHLEALLEYINLSERKRKYILVSVMILSLIIIGLNLSGGVIRELIFR